MTEEDHAALHLEIEEEVKAVMDSVFDDPSCRLSVLLNLLYAEFMALDDAEEISETVEAMVNIIGKRALVDMSLFHTVGSA